MADVQTELSRLLGKKVRRVRKTEEVPPRISVIDMAVIITGKNADAAAQDFRRLSERYPDVSAKCTDFQFLGQGKEKHQ